jgi:hypothetical protein
MHFACVRGVQHVLSIFLSLIYTYVLQGKCRKNMLAKSPKTDVRFSLQEAFTRSYVFLLSLICRLVPSLLVNLKIGADRIECVKKKTD